MTASRIKAVEIEKAATRRLMDQGQAMEQRVRMALLDLRTFAAAVRAHGEDGFVQIELDAFKLISAYFDCPRVLDATPLRVPECVG